MILKYSAYDMRGIVHEGSFRSIDSKEFKIGNWFLTHHICRFMNVPILQKIVDMKVAYYFQDEPIYDLFVEGGGCYKSNLLHCSLYDPIIRT